VRVPLTRRPGPAALFLILVVIGLLLNLGVRPLAFEEPRRALVALEMELGDQWIVPTTNGAPYLNKPPAFNWVLLVFMRLFGSTEEWVVRLPTVVSFLLSAWLVYRIARSYVRRQTAFRAAALFLTFSHLLFKATLAAEIDVFYSLLVTVQAAAIYSFERRERLLPLYVISYLVAALGVLTKGVPSVAFQGVTLMVWLAHTKKLRTLVSWQHVAGLCAFALCAGGYFALYAQRADPVPFLARMFLESSDRTLAGEKHGWGALFVHAATFPLQLLWLFVPWSAFAPLLLSKDFRSIVRENPLLRFCVLFIAANVVPYWLSPGARDRYMYMFLPFGAILVAAALERVRRDAWYPRLVEWALGACIVASTIAFVVVPFTRFAVFLSYPALWVVVCGGLLALLVSYWRYPAARLMTVLLAIASLRIGYDILVPNIRRTTSGESYYREVASVLNEKYPHEKILLAAGTRETAMDIPFVGRSIVMREVEHFPRFRSTAPPDDGRPWSSLRSWCPASSTSLDRHSSWSAATRSSRRSILRSRIRRT
jgi:4-amino-4-deoxy-L-arabinose transferase-like glycosyltransferase